MPPLHDTASRTRPVEFSVTKMAPLFASGSRISASRKNSACRCEFISASVTLTNSLAETLVPVAARRARAPVATSSEYAGATQTIRWRSDVCSRMRAFAVFLVSTISSYSSIGASLAPVTFAKRGNSNAPSSRNIRLQFSEPTRGVGTDVGDADGCVVGNGVGSEVVGEIVGAAVGSETTGEMDGDVVGSEVVGEIDGDAVGSEVVGEIEGELVGSEVVGEIDGEVVGSEVVGEIDGEAVGSEVVGDIDGEVVGSEVLGAAVGVLVGSEVAGEMVGDAVGSEAVGEIEGDTVGAATVGNVVGNTEG